MTRVSPSTLRRALRKPPHVIARRMADEVARELERIRAPRRAARRTIAHVLRDGGDATLDTAWARLAARPYPAWTERLDTAEVERLCPGEPARVLAAAVHVLERRVDLLGSGPTSLGCPVDWLCDVKSGRRWEPAFHREIAYVDLTDSSDVKVSWELSRLQWAIPAGQAYLLTGDERYAEAVRDLLDEWIEGNPYALTVNWSCTMDVALRILSWTWFFHVFAGSAAWTDEGFRARFLVALDLHADFTQRNLERSDINGNHYTADAAGLVFAGLFFGGDRGDRWADAGWSILSRELPRQVYPDGVDFEASTAYHRLVSELFFAPALYRERTGTPTPAAYRDRMLAMGRFAAAYTRPDGTTPAWGDADDGRALPFGGQPLGDHRYLPGLIGSVWANETLARSFPGPHAEQLWWLGPDEAVAPGPASPREPAAFPDSGFYVLQGPRDHVFVDAGPVGLAGRGGHGHNDCLGFEAWLDGTPLIVDAGTYVYTASPEWRNRFRSTAFHATPQVDGEEQNRFVRPDWLWSLTYDAVPELRDWSPKQGTLTAAHAGFLRLAHGVRPVRTFNLDRTSHQLEVTDRFEGDGDHEVRVPYGLPPGAEAEVVEAGVLLLRLPGGTFRLRYTDPSAWEATVEDGWLSPSYGVKTPRRVVVFRRSGPLEPLSVTFHPDPLPAP